MSYDYVPPQYEEYEMSESDCPSDGQVMQQLNAGFKEIYRRKHTRNNNPAGNYYGVPMPVYCEQHNRLTAPCPCNLPPDLRYCYCKSSPSPNQEGMFKSSTHITSNLKTCSDTKPASAPTIKKYPVTARTPRYIRATHTQLSKRPSALCLPVTYQPDPAMLHRARKTPAEGQHYRGQEASYAINDYVMRTTTTAAVKRKDISRPVDSEGDVSSRLNDLENLLTKLDHDDEEGGTEQVEISGVSEISKILKPKIPHTFKAKQDKILKLRAEKSDLTEIITNKEKVNKLEVREAPGDTIETILQKYHNDDAKNSEEKHINKNENKEDFHMKPETSRRQRHSLYLDQKPPLDDNSALELHKSKSYIVSLIDKALSKELGTVPGDKCTRKEFMNMNPKKAVKMVNRHSAPPNYEKMTLDIPETSTPKKEGQCVCKTEEPLYLKQLKQLRWSHLRHIQREAKRLADLERFLDSFSEAESPS